MFSIVDKMVQLDFPLGHHLHCMISQLPNHIRFEHETEPQRINTEKWQRIQSVLELVAQGEGNLKKLHFLLFPEATLPVEHFDEALAIIQQRFCANTVTMFGMEHMPLHAFNRLVERYADDNREMLDAIEKDRNSGDIDNLRVNWAAIIVKENSGRLRIFLQAKSHPFAGEESLDNRDLYHGKIFPLFRSEPTGFNFMAMICFDINTVIQHANELFFSTRQHLDFLAILECNPKPEHATFRDVTNGFYGEYLAATPGVRETITAFCNSAEATRDSLPQTSPQDTFGHSSVLIHKNHKMAPRKPVCRLRFGADSRLYYFNLPVFHEFDPRTTRMPLKVHSIFAPDASGGWQRINFSPVDTDNE
mgnify:CR=1 FL=1